MALETQATAAEQNGQGEEPSNRADLARHCRQVRSLTEALCAPLAVEDYVAQSMADASPVKWHLAHTSWFFETFLLAPGLAGAYQPYHPSYAYLFNSYYNAVGERMPRSQRGLLTRPTVGEVYGYRAHVDDRIAHWVEQADAETWRRLGPVLELGLHHEQQHQELILTDLKHLFGCNPLRPAYREQPAATVSAGSPARWLTHEENLCWIGHEGAGFAFDNESPRHRVFVEGYQIASRPTTNGEYRAFIEAGGYSRPELWLSEGWNVRCTQQWQAPLYWEEQEDGWWVLTLAGLKRLNDTEPVCHVSYYEADAFARWSAARLPTEAEWERAGADCPISGNFLDSGRLHPMALLADGKEQPLHQLFGDVWEWTATPYMAYPGYQPAEGALGEYNGKFMCGQFVLRGGSCVTARSHIRRTYRNFFPPQARWQFSGIRLARSLRS